MNRAAPAKRPRIGLSSLGEQIPTDVTFSGDALSTIAFDTQYASLQGVVYSSGVEVQYEWVSLIPRNQGIDCRVFAFISRSTTPASLLLSQLLSVTATEQLQFSLSDGWMIGVQTRAVTVTPGSATDSCIVGDVRWSLVADNVSSGDGTIVKGALKTGVVQDFTNDVSMKVDSTTVLAKNRKHDTCLKRVEFATKNFTRRGTIRCVMLTSMFNGFTALAASGCTVFAANWATQYLRVAVSTGAFDPSPVYFANATVNVPYGVLPFFAIGTDLQVIHLLLRCSTGHPVAPSLVFVSQPLETIDLSPNRPFDGTWIATVVYGGSSLSTGRYASQLNGSFGQVRMFCPRSIPTVVFNGLVGNTIYVVGSAAGQAPAAYPNSETYGFKPTQLETTSSFIDEINEEIDPAGEGLFRLV